MDFGPFFGCVCNYGATMITFIPTFGWFLYILSYIFDMHILIVTCATKIGQLWSFDKLGTYFL
jgi:hypothetical protein